LYCPSVYAIIYEREDMLCVQLMDKDYVGGSEVVTEKLKIEKEKQTMV